MHESAGEKVINSPGAQGCGDGAWTGGRVVCKRQHKIEKTEWERQEGTGA